MAALRQQQPQGGGNEQKKEEDVVIIDSYNGAIHVKTDAGNTNIISYNTSMFTSNGMNLKTTTAASSFNIMTFQQMMCEEKSSNVTPSVKSIYEDKKQLWKKTK